MDPIARLDGAFNRSALLREFLKRLPKENVLWLENFLEKNPWAATARDAGGVTALQIAAAHDDPDKAQILLELGADPNNRNDLGVTVLMTAYRTPQQRKFPGFAPEMVTLLLEYGAKADTQDRFGRTLSDMAGRVKDTATLTALRRHNRP